MGGTSLGLKPLEVRERTLKELMKQEGGGGGAGESTDEDEFCLLFRHWPPGQTVIISPGSTLTISGMDVIGCCC